MDPAKRLGISDEFVGYCVIQAIEAREWARRLKEADQAAKDAAVAAHSQRAAELAASQRGRFPAMP
jgi:flagellar motor switch protein FliG